MSKSDVFAWLLTYLLHGTLLLGLAWLVSRSRLGRSSAPLSEALWRFALFAPPLTALLQVAVGGEPLAGRLALGAPSAEPAAAVALPRSLDAVAFAPAATPWYADLSAADVALGLWALGAALLALRLSWSWLRFRSRLALRPRVVAGGLREQLDRLAGRQVRLTTSSRVSVPCALGLRRGEVCVPPRALLGLSDEEQEGMLAHELAHVARRDPAWLLAVNAWCALFFFQPLNWLARRRLRELSEVLSDSQAVEQTGRPLSLASCLTEVAGWSVERLPLPVPGMADRPSHLAQRVTRLLDGAAVRRVRPLWLGLGGLLLLALVALGAPGVSADGDEPRPPAERPALAEEIEEAEEAAADELSAQLAAEGLPPREAARLREQVAAARAEARAARRLAREAEPEIARAQEELQRALEAQLADLDRVIDEETREKLERIGREIEESMAPHLQNLQEQIERSLEPEMRRLEAELEALHLEADVERGLSAEKAERLREMSERLAHEAHRRATSSEALRQAIEGAQRHAAEQAMSAEAVRQAVEQAQRQSREAVEQALRLQREQMEQLHRELDVETKAITEQVRRELEKARRERREKRERDCDDDKEKP